MAPQFEVKATTTTSNFSLQWIEWSDPVSLVNDMKLPTTALLLNGVATNFMIGDYDPATEHVPVCGSVADSCIYFNVFTDGFTPILSGTARDFPVTGDSTSAA